MKKRKSVFVFAVLAAFALIALVGAAGKKEIRNEEAWERFVGEWVNTEISGTYENPQKIVVKPDYTGENWASTAQPSRSAEWQVELRKSWTDGKGNTYCQFQQRLVNVPWKYGNTSLCLMRVNKSGAVLEMNTKDGEVYGDYPDKIDPDVKRVSEGYYFVYNRK